MIFFLIATIGAAQANLDTNNQCVKDICGSPSNISSVAFDIDDLDEKTLEQVEEKYNAILPKIQKWIEYKRDTDLKYLDQLRGNISSNEVDIVDDNADLKHTFEYFMNSKFKVNLVHKQDGTHEVVAGISERAKKHFSKIQSKLANRYLLHFKKEIINDFETAFYRRVLTKREVKAELKQVKIFIFDVLTVDLNHNQYQVLHKLKKEFEVFFLKVEGLSKEKEIFEVCEQILRKVKDLVHFYNIKNPFRKYTKEFKVKNSEIALFLKQYAVAFELNNKIARIKKYYQNSEALGNAVKQCKNVYIHDLYVQARSETYERFSLELKNIKSLIKKEIFLKFDLVTNSKLTSIFDKIQIKNPIHYGDYKGLSARKFEEKVMKFTDSDFVNYYDEYDKSLVPLLDFVDRLTLSDGEVNPFKYTLSECNPINSIGRDMFIPSLELGASQIYFSDYTAHHHEDARGVIAHEVGHLVSLLFKKIEFPQEGRDKFFKLRKCISSRYLGDVTPRLDRNHFYSDNYYSEEDFADHFEYILGKNNRRNTFCNLIPKHANGVDFKRLELTRFSSRDPHSTRFTRLLRGEIYREKTLSLSCKEVLEKHPEPINFKLCSF